MKNNSNMKKNTAIEKPTYEELEKENKTLKRKIERFHFNLAAYVKNTHMLTCEMIIGTKLAYKPESLIPMLDFENENVDYIKSHHILK